MQRNIQKDLDMDSDKDNDERKRPVRRRTTLADLRDWYSRWVQIREARYRYLAAILDGEPHPCREAALKVTRKPMGRGQKS